MGSHSLIWGNILWLLSKKWESHVQLCQDSRFLGQYLDLSANSKAVIFSKSAVLNVKITQYQKWNFVGLLLTGGEDKTYVHAHKKKHVRKPASKNVHGHPLSNYVTTLVYINTQNSEAHLWGKTNFLNQNQRKLNCANMAVNYPSQHESNKQKVCIYWKCTSPVPVQSLQCLQNDMFCKSLSTSFVDFRNF